MYGTFGIGTTMTAVGAGLGVIKGTVSEEAVLVNIS